MGYYVYKIIDPRDDKTLYIGKGTGKRMFQHWKNALKYADRWDSGVNQVLMVKLRELDSLGLKPKYEIPFRTESEEEAYQTERRIISEIGLDNLCNIWPGRPIGSSKTVKPKTDTPIRKWLRLNYPEALWIDKYDDSELWEIIRRSIR